MTPVHTTNGSTSRGESHWEELLYQFDQAWRTGAPPRIEDYLSKLAANPDATCGATARRELLEQLVQVDLGYRWRRGPHTETQLAGPIPEQPRLEDYVAQYAELGPLERLSTELIGEEYWVRQRWGDRPERSEYAARFGHQQTLLEALARLDAELAVECAPGAPRVQESSAALSGESLFKAVGLTVTPQPVTSAASLVQEIRRCQLLDPARLSELEKGLQEGHNDPRALAEELVRRDWLTSYQVDRLLAGHGQELLLGQFIL
jgi:hypothetical protein